jgi:hypothetical protein
MARDSNKQVLLVMRANEMFRVHPQTDWSHTCSECGEPVGIFPSGQAVIKRYRPENIAVICNRCADADELSLNMPAPGALSEWKQAVDNPAFRKKA